MARSHEYDHDRSQSASVSASASASLSTTNTNTEIQIPPMNEVVVLDLIHKKLDEIRSGDLYVKHDLADDSVDQLLSNPTMYKKFEAIIARSWMDVSHVSNVNVNVNVDNMKNLNSENGNTNGNMNGNSNMNGNGNGGKTGTTKKKIQKMYVKALKVQAANEFVRGQIETYIHQRDGHAHAHAHGKQHGKQQMNGVGNGHGHGHSHSNGVDNGIDEDEAMEADFDDTDHQHQQHSHSNSNSNSLHNEYESPSAEDDTVSSLSDSKISRSSTSASASRSNSNSNSKSNSQKRSKKRKKSKKKKHKEKKKSKKRKRRHSSKSVSEDDDDDDDDNDERDHQESDEGEGEGDDHDDNNHHHEQEHENELEGGVGEDDVHDDDVDDDDDDDIEDDESAPPLTKREEKRLKRRIHKAQIYHKQEKERILKKVPKDVKNLFRTVGFAKWGKDFLPCMQLGPYDVGPGGVRDQWMEMFNNTMRNKRPMSRLMFWYGTPEEDLSTGFSFLPANKFVEYKEGCQRNLNQLPQKTKKKLDTGKKLTGGEQSLVDGLRQIAEDVKLEPHLRSPWLFEFEEDYEDYFEFIDDVTSDEGEGDDDKDVDGKGKKDKREDEDEDVAMAKSKLKQIKEPEKKKKKKKEEKEKEKLKVKPKAKAKSKDAEAKAIAKAKAKAKELESKAKAKAKEAEAKAKAKAEAKKKKALKAEKEKREKEKEREMKKKKRKRKAMDEEVAKKKSKSLDEEIEQEVAEEDAVMEIEAPSDNDEDDVDFNHDESSESEEEEDELYDEDDGVKAVTKKTTNSSSKVKKQILKSPLEIEQELFEECEKIFLPVMKKLHDAVDEVDAEKYLRKIDRDVHKLTPAFFRTHQIGLVVKAARSRMKENQHLNLLCKQITIKMKKTFNQKMDSEPKNFTPKLKKKVVKKVKTEVKIEKRTKIHNPVEKDSNPQSSNKVPQLTTDISKEPSVPMKVVKKEIFVEIQKPAIKAHKPVKTKAPRKSFSLAGMIERKPTPTPASMNATGQVKDRTKSKAADVTEKIEQPEWTLKYKSSGPSFDTNPDRAFAMLFLNDAVARLPKGNVDPSSIAVALENTLHTKYGSDHDKYTERLHEICAAIAGKNNRGTSSLARKIVDGSYGNPLDIVDMPRKLLFQSFEGDWIS